MRRFVRGDIDGFFGLALDNLVQLIVITALCAGPLGFPPELLYGRVLPGTAIALIIGNLFYARQALRLARATGRDDVCALPYGINTPSVFLYVFLVMLPVKFAAEAAGLDPVAAAERAWQAGLVAALGSGIIEVFGALVAERIRKATPRAAMLATLAGIAVGFISMPFLFQAFAVPLVSLVPLAVILVIYFGGVRFRGGVPGGLVAVVIGTCLAWATGVAPGSASVPSPSFYLPIPVVGDLYAGLADGHLLPFLPVILAMGLFNVVGSLQNIESAEAAGDSYDTRSSLAVNGLGTLAGTLFGSCFPTTIYIGHPGWKALGARSGYSVLNAIFCTIICLSGTVAAIAWLVPVEAALPIVVWIAVVITAQGFQATPRAHAPAVVIGLLPGIAAWGVLMLKAGLRVSEQTLPDGTNLVLPIRNFSPELMGGLAMQDIAWQGAFALESGALFTATIWAAATVAIIERQWNRAAIWFVIAAALAAVGLMHHYALQGNDVVLALGPSGWEWPLTYSIMAALMLVVPKCTEVNRELSSLSDQAD